ncbi:hypothetical protein TEQG_08604 [Trichophyton equinum CBS 127.97]|uniref:Uncharacterized protein n=1 Tax=Trichophyton equinum (strain ATCC MYA-4606 / CBS 127.97) TaxID=559882 RepID=F2PKF7_TRIEC|nr:hypothetical protein TEQG_08604 [Trichophyton equinum CBS 127.97]
MGVIKRVLVDGSGDYPAKNNKGTALIRKGVKKLGVISIKDLEAYYFYNDSRKEYKVVLKRLQRAYLYLKASKYKYFIYTYIRIVTPLFKITKGYKKGVPSLLVDGILKPNPKILSKINLEEDDLLISRDAISRAKSLKKLITKLEKARVVQKEEETLKV